MYYAYIIIYDTLTVYLSHRFRIFPFSFSGSCDVSPMHYYEVHSDTTLLLPVTHAVPYCSNGIVRFHTRDCTTLVWLLWSILSVLPIWSRSTWIMLLHDWYIMDFLPATTPLYRSMYHLSSYAVYTRTEYRRQQDGYTLYIRFIALLTFQLCRLLTPVLPPQFTLYIYLHIIDFYNSYGLYTTVDAIPSVSVIFFF